MKKSANRTPAFEIPGRTGFLLCMLLFLQLPCAVIAGQLERYPDTPGGTPALVLEDLGRSVRSLQDYRGKVVLVNFWASWCGPCVIEMPSLERLQQAMTGKPFAILAVNVGETHGKVWNFASRHRLTFPLLLDNDGRTASQWEVTHYPTTYLVDADGAIQYVAYGPRSWDSPEMIHAIEAMTGTARSLDQQATSRHEPDALPPFRKTQVSCDLSPFVHGAGVPLAAGGSVVDFQPGWVYRHIPCGITPGTESGYPG